MLRTAVHWVTKKARKDLRFIGQALGDCFRPMTAVDGEIPALSAEPGSHATLMRVGHACFLLRVDDLLVLTDPTLYPRIGPHLGPVTIGPKRYVRPAVRQTDLERVDVILISHAHFDHLCRRSLKALPRAATVIVPRGTADLVDDLGFSRVVELAHGERWRAAGGEVTVEAFPVHHPTARWRYDTHRSGNGYTIRSAASSLAFIGDTAHDPRHIEHYREMPDVDAAIIPIASYDPFIWNHCTPEQALDIAEAFGARTVIPSAHETFVLSREPLHEPAERFRRVPGHAGLDRRPLAFGESVSLVRGGQQSGGDAAALHRAGAEGR